MKIYGLQKLTLLDYPSKTACTVFTAGCNMRCPFCHNPSLVTRIDNSYIISEEEFFSFLSKRKGVLDGVCVTGGEPLLQPDLKDFIAKIKEKGFLVKLDTNGALPEKLKDIISSDLVDYIAMDIKNTPEKYAVTCGMEEISPDDIYKSINLIINSGKEYEFRTTAVREFHTPEDFKAIAGMIKGAKAYYIKNFVDSGDTIVKGFSPLNENDLQEARAEALKILDKVEIRGI